MEKAMRKLTRLACAIALGSAVAEGPAAAQTRNEVLGTWRMVSATLDPGGRNEPAYGARPNGMLVFTADMHFVEVLTDADVPRFASSARGQGTDAENRAAMAGGIGFFGTYSVDESGQFSGNTVQGSTFPNWIGGVRTRKELQLVVEGDRMTENFTRPDGTRIAIVFQRVR
jgi:hypothetical protein